MPYCFGIQNQTCSWSAIYHICHCKVILTIWACSALVGLPSRDPADAVEGQPCFSARIPATCSRRLFRLTPFDLRAKAMRPSRRQVLTTRLFLQRNVSNMDGEAEKEGVINGRLSSLGALSLTPLFTSHEHDRTNSADPCSHPYSQRLQKWGMMQMCLDVLKSLPFTSSSRRNRDI